MHRPDRLDAPGGDRMEAAEEDTLSDALDAEAFDMMRCRETEDHLEAPRAFAEKRPPAFKGR